MYRYNKLENNELNVFIAKFGGSAWEKVFNHSWTFPKGEKIEGESDIQCALREFSEETSITIDFDIDKFIDLGEYTFRSSSNKEEIIKTNHIFAYEYDLTPDSYEVPIISNLFIDTNNFNKPTPELKEKAYYFELDRARRLLVKSQQYFLDSLIEKLKNGK